MVGISIAVFFSMFCSDMKNYHVEKVQIKSRCILSWTGDDVK